MAESSNTVAAGSTALERIPYVVVRLASGQLVLRHPSELKPQPYTPPKVGP